MPARRESGRVGSTYRSAAKRKRQAPASQGHPSRGGTTVGGGTDSKQPTRYKSPTGRKPSTRYTAPRPDVTLGSSPSRTGHTRAGTTKTAEKRQNRRRAALRSQRKTARIIRGIAGKSTPLGELERQSMRFSARADDALARTPRQRYLDSVERRSRGTAPRLPRNDYIERVDVPQRLDTRSERAYAKLAKPQAVAAYRQRLQQAPKAERRSARHMAATRAIEHKNILDKAIGGGAAVAGEFLGSQGVPFARQVGRDIAKSDIKGSRLPSALWHGVTEGRDDDVKDPDNFVQIAEGAVGGLANLLIHPEREVRAMAEDYKKRYGDYLSGKITKDQFKKQVRKEPRLSYIADAASLIPVGGTAAAATGRVLARGAARGAARRGASTAASRATRVADYLDPKVARPGLASRAGRPVPQRTPTVGGFRLTGQRSLDRARLAATRSRAKRGSGKAKYALDNDTVQAITKLGQKRVERKAARPEYSRWRARLHALRQRMATRPLKKVRGKIGLDNMENGVLAVGMMTGRTTREGIRDAARGLINDIEEWRRANPGDADSDAELHDDLVKLNDIVNERVRFPDEKRFGEALDILREANEALKTIHPHLDEGVRVHELEAARRLAGVEKGAPEVPESPNLHLQNHREAREFLREAYERAEVDQPPTTQLGRGGASPAGPSRQAFIEDAIKTPDADYEDIVGKTRPGLRKSVREHDKLIARLRKSGLPDDSPALQQALWERNVLKAVVKAREGGKKYLAEEGLETYVLQHGTTKLAAGKIAEEGFKPGRSHGVWSGTDEVAGQYDRGARVTAYNTPRNPVWSNSDEYIDIAAKAGGVEERAQLLRDAGYDAIIVPDDKGGIRAINMLDPERVSPNAPLPRPEGTNRYMDELRQDPTGPPLRLGEPQGNVGRARYIEDELRSRGENPDRISYFHHDKFDDVERAANAPGQGQFAAAPPKATTYALLDSGRMNLNAAKVLPEQMARAIKSNVAEEIIGEIISKWTLPYYVTDKGTRLHARGLTYRERLTLDSKLSPDAKGEYVWFNPQQFGQKIAHGTDLDNVPDDFFNDLADGWEAGKNVGAPDEGGGWYLLDATRAKQMEQSIAFNRALGSRLARKVFKGVPSKLVLMASPSWAILQVINNAGLAGLAGMVNPLQYGRAVKVMRQLRDEFPEEYERLMGASAQGLLEHEFERTRLGSQGDRIMREHPIVGRPIALFREAFSSINRAIDHAPEGVGSAIRRTGVAGREVANFRLLFHFDAAQNAWFRKTFMMDEAKRIKLQGLQRSMQQEAGAIQRIMRNFSKERVDPEDLARLANDPEALDHLAKATNDLFGDYTSFTPAERKWLESNMMFYGFLRFSLRFTLYTMPFQHPVATSLLAKLSSLQNEEIRKLMKWGPNEPIPFGAIGAVYGDGQKTKLPTNRINPFLNPVTSSMLGDAPSSQVFTMFSPMLMEAVQQGVGMNFFTGKTWQLPGPTATQRLTGAADPRMPGWDSLSDWETRARIALRHGIELTTPGRATQQAAGDDIPQADTSLPWSPKPINYADEDTLKSIKARRKAAESFGKKYTRSLFDPVYGAVTGDWPKSYDREVAKYLKENELRYLGGGKKKPRKPGLRGPSSSIGIRGPR